MTAREALQANLQGPLGMSPDAVGFLLDLWDTIQVLDDIADGDPVSADQGKEAAFASLGRLPLNPFYDRHKAALSPQIALATIKWGVSDTVERLGEANAKSYMWRAGYYDVVALVMLLDTGFDHDKAMMVYELYGETFEEYMREQNA